MKSRNEIAENIDEEHTPKLFSDEKIAYLKENSEMKRRRKKMIRCLFDQDTNEEEDFEIPAFLRRQKF